MQHAALHTTTVQPSSHNQRHVLIGKQCKQYKTKVSSIKQSHMLIVCIKRTVVATDVDR